MLRVGSRHFARARRFQIRRRERRRPPQRRGARRPDDHRVLAPGQGTRRVVLPQVHREGAPVGQGAHGQREVHGGQAGSRGERREASQRPPRVAPRVRAPRRRLPRRVRRGGDGEYERRRGRQGERGRPPRRKKRGRFFSRFLARQLVSPDAARVAFASRVAARCRDVGGDASSHDVALVRVAVARRA